MTGEGSALRIIETHAGAGLYDLRGDQARKSKEAEAGVMRLMSDPAAPMGFDELKAAILLENPDGPVALYPGSPLQLIGALSPSDAYFGCELRPDDCEALANLLANRKAKLARAILADGYGYATSPPTWSGRTLVVVDPPFESGDEYDRIVKLASVVVARGDILAIWTPIKDLESLDVLVSNLESLAGGNLQVGEVRLRPLSDPMKMNGCSMILIGAPDLTSQLEPLARWVVAHCGEVCGTAKVYVP